MGFSVGPVVVALAFASSPGEAAQFLGGRLEKAELDQVFLQELSSKQDLEIQASLQPMFAALPKNEHGRLEPITVRYAIHRYFVQKHGWFVKGLDPEGAAWNSTSHDLSKENAPRYLQGLFEERLQGRGMDISALAGFAATMSDLIHGEGVQAMQGVYEVLGLPLNSPVEANDFDTAVRAYMAVIIAGCGAELTNKSELEALEERAERVDTSFRDIVLFLKDLRMSRDWLDRSGRNPFVSDRVSFERATQLTKDILHNFGKVPQGDCRWLQQEMYGMEEDGTGRVPLAKFYAHKNLPIQESVDYLRALGALEESPNRKPRLLIANYVDSASRCVPFSGYFQVCCFSECEGLLTSVEKALAMPTGLPSRIAEIVSGLASETVPAPRNLSATLLRRLDEIADRHGGHVPLHGRLFMQWMHHAYPRECPFPHLAGSVRPVSQDEWLMSMGINDAMASEEEIRKQAADVAKNEPSMAPDMLPWSSVEELVAGSEARKRPRSWISACLQIAMALMLISAFALPLLRAPGVLTASSKKLEPQQSRQSWV